MIRPRIFVCVVTYNQHQYIETCLRSILDQNVQAEVQVLVGDDASTDGTSAIVQALACEYGAHLQHLRRESNLGAFANLHDILLRANADYVARVDGDDYWLPGKLARQLAYLQAHPDCSAVYTNALTVNESGEPIGVFNDMGDIDLTLSMLLRQGNSLNNSSILYRSANSTGWLEGDQIDFQLHLWQARHGFLRHIGEPMSVYRVNTQGSLMSSANERVRELYWQAIQSVPRELVSNIDYTLGIIDFLRRVCFRTAITNDLSLLRRWAPIVYEASPYGCIITTILLLNNIVRMGIKMTLARLSMMAGYKKPPVLYRR